MTHPNYTTPTTPENVEDRFWSKVDRSGDCWLYVPGPSTRYGIFCPGHQGKVSAHRFSYELAYGPIPLGMLVCHRCDVKRCVRPDHLFLGTSADNIHDMHAKGRGQRGDKHSARLRPETRPRGSAHGRARLTERDVTEIRAALALGTRGTVLARRFCVTVSTISRINKGHIWRHVA